MTFESFDLKLTDADITLYQRLWQWARDTRNNRFSSDTIRNAGLAEDLLDSLGRVNVGTRLARMQYNRLIELVDREPSKRESNHNRRINVYKFRGLQPSE